MKLAVVAAALAMAGVASAETCTSVQQTSAYAALAGLLVLDSFNGCTTDSGFSLLYSPTMPTDDQYRKMCMSSSCPSLISSILTLNPPDCVFTVPTSGLQLNFYEFVDDFSYICWWINPTTAPPTDTPPTEQPTESPVTNTPTFPPIAC